jgi:hypothetical protein
MGGALGSCSGKASDWGSTHNGFPAQRLIGSVARRRATSRTIAAATHPGPPAQARAVTGAPMARLPGPVEAAVARRRVSKAVRPIAPLAERARRVDPRRGQQREQRTSQQHPRAQQQTPRRTPYEPYTTSCLSSLPALLWHNSLLLATTRQTTLLCARPHTCRAGGGRTGQPLPPFSEHQLQKASRCTHHPSLTPSFIPTFYLLSTYFRLTVDLLSTYCRLTVDLLSNSFDFFSTFFRLTFNLLSTYF